MAWTPVAGPSHRGPRCCADDLKSEVCLRSAYIPTTFCLRSAILLAFDIILCSSESAAYVAPTFRLRSAYVPQNICLLLGYTPMRIRAHQYIHVNTHQHNNAE